MGTVGIKRNGFLQPSFIGKVDLEQWAGLETQKGRGGYEQGAWRRKGDEEGIRLVGACGGAVEITWALPEAKELKFVPAAVAAVAQLPAPRPLKEMSAQRRLWVWGGVKIVPFLLFIILDLEVREEEEQSYFLLDSGRRKENRGDQA